ncbi:MAG: ATPase domain-containing protein [Pseudomonadota bacterium]|nr:ATPase domain-containing protein [Pseudomonadota bacterium]
MTESVPAQEAPRRPAPGTKAPTGIPGVDEILGGGLPRGRPTLVIGDAGAGKTVFCLQALVNGATHSGEPGLYLSFEEDGGGLRRTVESFAWGGVPDDLHFHDALVGDDFESQGDFDLAGLLAILDHLCERHGISRIVLDGLDQLVGLLPDPVVREHETRKLLGWIRARDRTLILTGKALGDPAVLRFGLAGIEYGVDCVIRLERERSGGTVRRTFNVAKYRGSAHAENAYPYAITSKGIAVSYLASYVPDMNRAAGVLGTVPTGVYDLDEMLRGGLIRGSTTLLTGSPGTAKTTLSGIFIDAACRRGDRALMVLYDDYPDRVVANLRSIGLDLKSHVDNGLLRLEYIVSSASGPEQQVAVILNWIAEHGPACIVIDPLSALVRSGRNRFEIDAAEKLIQTLRARDITAVMTSLTDAENHETSASHISTVADTWIHLDYGIRSGERNRVLTIVKARGIGHSNKVRELVLGDDGVRLDKVYPLEQGMLIGGARIAREQQDFAQAREDRQSVADRLQRQAQDRLRLIDRIAQLSEELRQIDRVGNGGASDDDQH